MCGDIGSIVAGVQIRPDLQVFRAEDGAESSFCLGYYAVKFSVSTCC